MPDYSEDPRLFKEVYTQEASETKSNFNSLERNLKDIRDSNKYKMLLTDLESQRTDALRMALLVEKKIALLKVNPGIAEFVTMSEFDL